MPKPRLLLDVDGILADFVGATVKVMSQMAGKDYKSSDITMWEVTEILEDHSLREKAKDQFNRAGFCLTFDVYDGAQDAVAQLQEMTELFFVTAPMIKNPTWMPDRVAWLEHHFGVDHKHVVFASKKHIIAGDFMVDDSPDNIEGFLKTNPHGKGILWNRPYNLNMKHSEHVTRVDTWDQVLRMIAG